MDTRCLCSGHAILLNYRPVVRERGTGVLDVFGLRFNEFSDQEFNLCSLLCSTVTQLLSYVTSSFPAARETSIMKVYSTICVERCAAIHCACTSIVLCRQICHSLRFPRSYSWFLHPTIHRCSRRRAIKICLLISVYYSFCCPWNDSSFVSALHIYFPYRFA